MQYYQYFFVSCFCSFFFFQAEDGIRDDLVTGVQTCALPILHSGCVETELRGAGFAGPIARIPHGAWIPETGRFEYRDRLGLNETTPLIGIFGFLKPYKRIADSLRAFRRLLRLQPAPKLILVGEPHPHCPLQSLIQSLDLSASVRLLAFVPIAEFV